MRGNGKKIKKPLKKFKTGGIGSNPIPGNPSLPIQSGKVIKKLSKQVIN